MSFQTVEHASKEDCFGKNIAEKGADQVGSSFFTERRIEENGFEKIE